MSSKAILQLQRDWASGVGLPVDTRGYLPSVEANFCAPISAKAREAFEAADGGEMRDAVDRPAKMRALHSSSALAVNFFDYWTDRDAAPLSAALGVGEKIVDIAFERKFPTGLQGNAPNLDVVIKCASGRLIAIESKFTEWMYPKQKVAFKPKYFPENVELWTQRGLPKAQSLASDINAGRVSFTFLDAPQLLKHVLGIAGWSEAPVSLMYLYYDGDEPASSQHAAEIQKFAELIDAKIGFQARTYQSVFTNFAEILSSQAGVFRLPAPALLPRAGPVKPPSRAHL